MERLAVFSQVLQLPLGVLGNECECFTLGRSHSDSEVRRVLTTTDDVEKAVRVCGFADSQLCFARLGTQARRSLPCNSEIMNVVLFCLVVKHGPREFRRGGG